MQTTKRSSFICFEQSLLIYSEQLFRRTKCKMARSSIFCISFERVPLCTAIVNAWISKGIKCRNTTTRKAIFSSLVFSPPILASRFAMNVRWYFAPTMNIRKLSKWDTAQIRMKRNVKHALATKTFAYVERSAYLFASNLILLSHFDNILIIQLIYSLLKIEGNYFYRNLKRRYFGTTFSNLATFNFWILLISKKKLFSKYLL